MGRTTVCGKVVDRSFATMRSAGPIFALPDMSEAIDFYLALKEDVDGIMTKEEYERQIKAFSPLPPDEQAEVIPSKYSSGRP